MTKKITIIGLGFVGLPLAIHFASKGYTVHGMDLDENKVNLLNHGTSYITDVSSSDLKDLLKQNRFTASLPSENLKEASYIIVTVPTPLSAEKAEPDLTFLISAAEFISEHLNPGQTIVFESSTYPGTLEEVILPIFTRKGYVVGKDYFLGYSPERIDPGNSSFTLSQIPKIVSGQTEPCLNKVKGLYGRVFDKIVPVSSPKVAELSKIFENIQRLVNISLVNEMELICHQMQIDFRECLRAAATKPFGFTPYWPGPGIGGHCIPIDPLYFQWKAKQYGLTSRLIEEAHLINQKMPSEMVARIKRLLPDSAQTNSSPILLLGVTYKKDVKDLRESTALEIFQLLWKEGFPIQYHDPLVPELSIEGQLFVSTPFSLENLKKSSLVVILTDHTTINWDLLAQYGGPILDTRGILKHRKEALG